jgi:hypothetical protein
MPGNLGWIITILDKKISGPAQEIAAIQVFDPVDYFLLTNKVSQPGEEQMGLVP